MTTPETPRDEPVFHEPWQARTLALAVSLQDAGAFSAEDWAQALGRAVLRFPADADTPAAQADAYYRACMAALEELIGDCGLAVPSEIDAAADTWTRAAEATPHGQPILFETGLPGRE